MQKSPDMPLFPDYRKWRITGLKDVDGVIVGVDQTQEWLLPWWWDHYKKHNDFPVAFVDFGMSSDKKNWCRERGEFIRLYVADIFVAQKEEIDPTLIREWEAEFGKLFWQGRNAWFKKPLACLQSPFRRSLWIDLDCEIRGVLAPLFSYCEYPLGISLVRERGGVDYPIYNSGVIAFQRENPLVLIWADLGIDKNSSFRGDQELLSWIIAEQGLCVSEMPEAYNWSRCYGDNPDALVYHWHGEFGRSVIRHQINRITFSL